MCISATVTGSTVEYVLQSSGSNTVGWMAMGFGSTMANSPMVIMWPNSDDSITLSQRMASAEVMPTVVADPPRVANLSTSLSSTTGSQPKFAYTIAANSDTLQNVIWAFGTVNPDSSSVDANLQQHLDSGTFQLDLTKAISSNSSDTSSTGSSGIPLQYYQKLIVAHAILCVVGFLAILPAGALFARYLRTVSPQWFKGHMTSQVFLAGPVIIAGVALGIEAVVKAGSKHLDDTHKKCGLAIFVLYFVQLALGSIIHWFKPRGTSRRPPQNYLHAVVGLLLIALAFYQVRVGYRHEWPAQTGRDPLPKAADIVWYIWVVLLPVIYFAGLALLPRQFRQERMSYKVPQSSDTVRRDSTER
ncbi:hypothetical protein PILCRDRAFT_663916 [Piloderma croceum F 1598]|uniref:Cytochrome b561 domain-containing protein n=1 Tax=Piloderma croceum (strain F 1598) TaxID=765440 RepID=A0A0C3F779_PILCF|nr:hypothetical protein PILCRDRAFT_663916 [Piloderma croceum F 1598]